MSKKNLTICDQCKKEDDLIRFGGQNNWIEITIPVSHLGKSSTAFSCCVKTYDFCSVECLKKSVEKL